MLSLTISALAAGQRFALVTVDLDALVVYGLLALLVGMIAWSKYSDPPLPLFRAVDPVADPSGTRDRVSAIAPVAPVAVDSPVAGREQS